VTDFALTIEMQSKPRTKLMLAGLFALGCVSVLGYACATRVQPARHNSDTEPPTAAHSETASGDTISAAPAVQPSQGSDIERAEASSQSMTAETVAQWSIQATDGDSQTRSVAIVALAAAPRAQAVPILQRVLRTGELPDRQLALGSLRTLALDQGDADGAIRGALRQATYHGDDDDVVRGAQAALDDIDRDLAEQQ
jgi:hypothetical protein